MGSIFAANTAATRAFVPQVDVGLIAVGPDPPISGAELDLVEEVAREAGHLVVVLNKADQVSDAQRAESLAFTRHAIEARLGRNIDPILAVRARERIREQRETRDWTALENRLRAQSEGAGDQLVKTAGARAVKRVGRRVLAELAAHEPALVRPPTDTRARVTRLRETPRRRRPFAAGSPFPLRCGRG